MEKIRIKIDNMTCEACIKLSKSRISKIEGVKDVRISDIGGETEIMADRDISIEEIQKALAGTDYKIIKL
ncbi:MAG: heavy metal-associated domain-containing protein [Patescibacteria group bacterium]